MIAWWSLAVYSSLTLQLMLRSIEVLTRVMSITDDFPALRKVGTFPMFAIPISRDANVSRTFSPLGFVHLLPYSVAHAFRSAPRNTGDLFSTSAFMLSSRAWNSVRVNLGGA